MMLSVYMCAAFLYEDSDLFCCTIELVLVKVSLVSRNLTVFAVYVVYIQREGV